MSDMEWIKGQEYSTVEFPEKYLPEDKSELKPCSERYLGLHFDDKEKLKASYFVGQVWASPSEMAAIRIAPKHDENVDYFGMISKCMEYPVVASHLLEDGFSFRSEESALPLQKGIKDPV